MATSGLVALVLDDIDAEQFKDEFPELADETRIVIAGTQGWAVMHGVIPTTLSLGYAAALHPSIGGTEAPRHVRLALMLSAHRMPTYIAA